LIVGPIWIYAMEANPKGLGKGPWAGEIAGNQIGDKLLLLGIVDGHGHCPILGAQRFGLKMANNI
jgi:hypothetical protein